MEAQQAQISKAQLAQAYDAVNQFLPRTADLLTGSIKSLQHACDQNQLMAEAIEENMALNPPLDLVVGFLRANQGLDRSLIDQLETVSTFMEGLKLFLLAFALIDREILSDEEEARIVLQLDQIRAAIGSSQSQGELFDDSTEPLPGVQGP